MTAVDATVAAQGLAAAQLAEQYRQRMEEAQIAKQAADAAEQARAAAEAQRR